MILLTASYTPSPSHSHTCEHYFQSKKWVDYIMHKQNVPLFVEPVLSSFFLIVTGLGLHQPLLEDMLWWRSYYILKQWHVLCNPISGSITYESCMWNNSHEASVLQGATFLMACWWVLGCHSTSSNISLSRSSVESSSKYSITCHLKVTNQSSVQWPLAGCMHATLIMASYELEQVRRSPINSTQC